MTKTKRSPRAVLLTTIVSLAIFATACGGGGEVVTGEVASEAALAAEANQPLLDTTGNLADTELLDSRTGQIQSLADVVTGDRAVLIWYWAPH